MERKLKFPADKNIRDLPGRVMGKARDALDTRMVNNVTAWRAFAAILPPGRFYFRYDFVCVLIV
jgi:hypothetical protein